MGHRQDMNRQQRIKWDSMQYKARLDARKGNNFAYTSDELERYLLEKSYKTLVFPNGEIETSVLSTAKERVEELRNTNCFARIVVNPCYRIRGGQTYSVWYRSKKKK